MSDLYFETAGAEKTSFDTSSMRENVEQATSFRGIQVSPQELDVINRALVVSKDPEEEAWRWANAIQYTRLYGKPITETVKNLESYNLAFLGKANPPKTAVRAIADSYKLGSIYQKMNELGNRVMASSGTDKEALKEYGELKLQLNKYADNVDNRKLVTEALKAGAQSVPYMVESAAVGAVGAGLFALSGGIAPLGIAAYYTLGSAIGSAKGISGNEYMRLVENGTDHDTAAALSVGFSALMGGIEVALGADRLLSSLLTKGQIGSITAKVAQKIITKNDVLTVAARATARLGMSTFEEAAEEGAQEIAAKVEDYLAAEIMEKKGVEIPRETLDKIVSDVLSNAKAGALAAPVFGLIGAPLAVKADYASLKKMKNFAKGVDEETFKRNAAQSESVQNVISAIPEEKRDEALSQIWKNAQEEEKAESEKNRTKQGKVEYQEGHLYTQEQTITDRPDGVVDAIIKAGSPSSGDRYGYLRYEKRPAPDGSTEILLKEAHWKKGYDSVGPELLLSLAAKYPGIEIVTNDASNERVSSLVERVKAGSPTGKIQWFGEENEAPEKTEFRSRLITAFPKADSLQVELNLVMHENRMTAMNLDWKGYRNKVFSGEIVRADDATVQSLFKQQNPDTPARANAATIFDKEGKALIMAGKGADFRTLTHETLHVFRRTVQGTDLGKRLSSYYGVVGDVWTEKQEEQFVEDGLRHLAYGELKDERMKGVWEQIASFLKRVWAALTKSDALSPELASILDELYSSEKSPLSAMAGRSEAQTFDEKSIEEAENVDSGEEAAQERPIDDEPQRPSTFLKGAEIVEIPVGDIYLSEDVPNFKEGANAKTGAVDPLQAERYERLGTAPIVVWERLNGKLEVITGRHRLDLARRLNENTIPGQIVREADGFTSRKAMSFDAEANIRDGQGSLRDYANYFRNSEITREQASSRGLLARDKGRAGYYLGRNAGNGLYALYRAGQIGEKKAAAIAEATTDGRIQELGIKKARDLTAEELFNYLNILSQSLTGKATQENLFGDDESFMIEAANIAKEATKVIDALNRERTALEGARRLGKADRKEVLEKYGVNAGDEAAISSRLDRIDDELDGWEGWATDSAKMRELRKRLGLPVKDEEVEIQEEETFKDTGTLFERVDYESALNREAVDTFGTTEDPSEAGYVLSDGRMLDFSGRSETKGTTAVVSGGIRLLSHAAIMKMKNLPEKNDISFMKHSGAVKVDFDRGLAYSVGIPTHAAEQTIVKYATGRITLHIDGENGEVLGRKTVDVKDISDFYSNPSAPDTLPLFSNPSLLFEEDLAYGGPLDENELDEISYAFRDEKELGKAFADILSRIGAVGWGNDLVSGRTIKQGEITKRYENLKRVRLAGKKVRSLSDIAALFALSRNPRLEVFQVLYVKGNEIVAHSAISSGLIGQSSALETGNQATTIESIKGRAKRVGADKIYIAHNHPSGELSYSRGDEAVTLGYSNALGDLFKAHIITDHTQYSVLTVSNNKLNASVNEFALPKVPFVSEGGDQIARPSQIALAAFGTLNGKENNTVFIVLDNQNRIIGWNYYNSDPDREVNRRLLDMYGGMSAVVVTNDKGKYDTWLEEVLRARGSSNDVILDLVHASDFGAVYRSAVSDDNYMGGRWQASVVLKQKGKPVPVVSYSEKKDGPEQYALFEKVADAAALIGRELNGRRLPFFQRFSRSSDTVYLSFDFGGRRYSIRIANHEIPFDWSDYSINTTKSESIPGLYAWLDNLVGSKTFEGNALFEADGLFTFFETDTPEFKAWFGDSKVVDGEGKPLVVYHGSPDIRFLKDDGPGSFQSEKERFGMGRDTHAHWFASSIRAAKTYTDPHRAFDYQNAEEGTVACYLKIENPLVIEADGKEWRESQKRGKTTDVIARARKQGADGVIIRNVRDDYSNDKRTPPTDTYVVFSPAQIKSINNRGTWDAADPRILFQTEEGDQALFEEDQPIEDPEDFSSTHGEFASFLASGENLNDFLVSLWAQMKRDYDPQKEAKSEAGSRLASHPFVIGAAITVGKNHKDLDAKVRRAVLGSVRRNELAFKELYADVMNNAKIGQEARAERKSVVGELDIKNPRLRGYTRMTVAERQAIIDRIRDEKVKEKIDAGTITDEDIGEYIKRLEHDREVLSTRERSLEKTREQKAAISDTLKSAREEASLQSRFVAAEIRALYRLRDARNKVISQIFARPAKDTIFEMKKQILYIQDYLKLKKWEVIKTENGGYKKTGNVIEPAFIASQFSQLFRDSPDLSRIMKSTIVNRINNKPVSAWTLEQLEELRDIIDDLKRIGVKEYKMRKLLKAGEYRRERVGLSSDYRASKKYKPPFAHGSVEEKKQIDSLDFQHTTSLATMNMDRFAQYYLDHGKSDGRNWNLLVAEEREHYREKMAQHDRRVNAIKKVMESNTVKPDSLYRKITIEKAGPRDSSLTITASDLMMIMLALRNDDSRKAVIYGNLFDERERAENDNHILRMTGNSRVYAISIAIQMQLTKEEKQVAEAIAADFNHEFDRLNHEVIEVTNEELRRVANYIPIRRRGAVFDKMADEIVNDIMARNGYSKSGTDKGWTKARTKIGEGNQTPIVLDLWGSFLNAVEKQEHMIAYTEYHRKLSSVYSGRQSGAVREGIIHLLGKNGIAYVDKYIAEIANPVEYKDRDLSENMLRWMRGHMAVGYLAFRWSSVLNQLVTSPLPFLAYAPGQLAGAAVQAAADARHFIDEVEGMSTFLRHRQIDPMIERLKGFTKEGVQGKINQISDFGMKGLVWADRWTVAIGWKSVYDKARIDGLEHEDAVRKADDITLKTQPSARGVDLSPLFRDNNEWKRVLTQFGTQLNVIWQQMRFDLPTAVKEKRIGEAVGILTSLSIAGLGMGVIKQLRGKDKLKDDEDFWKMWVYYSLSQGFDSIPLIGSAVSATMKRIITGDKRSFQDNDVLPVIGGLLSGAEGIAAGKGRRATKDIAEALALAFGVPVLAIEEYLGALIDRLGDE